MVDIFEIIVISLAFFELFFQIRYLKKKWGSFYTELLILKIIFKFCVQILKYTDTTYLTKWK